MENTENKSGIHPAEPRRTVQVHMPDGTTLEGPVGTALEGFARAHTGRKFKTLAALADGSLRELIHQPETDARVVPLDLRTPEGVRIYRRSLAFMMVTAAQELYPDAEVFIDYTVPYGGYFCDVRGRGQFTTDELARLEAHMRTIVEEDNSIRRIPVPIEQAKEIFGSRREFDKVSLVDKRGKEDFMMYELRNRKDAFYGYMAPSTGYLRIFALAHLENGFVLQYPRRQQPDKLLEKHASPMLEAIFQEYGEWLRLLRVENVGQFNNIINKGRIRGTILVCEALQERRIADIAGRIAEEIDRVKVVFIAGPSSSGKTTFSKRRAIQLLTRGIRPFTLEMDRYFVDRKFTPKDKNGEYDFEVLEALDLCLLNQNLNDLMNGREVTLPEFNFVTGTREMGPTVRLAKDQVIIAEGIHGLNPELVSDIPPEKVFRIYISALTQLNIDRHNRISTTDTRLIRRIVRDAAHRGWKADDTLEMWEKVRRGEKNYIFPYQENADEMFNSALAYELAVLKPFATPLLLQVKPASPNSVAAKRLLAFLNLFEGIPADYVPDNSLLREFVGGSILSDYLPGKPLR